MYRYVAVKFVLSVLLLWMWNLSIFIAFCFFLAYCAFATSVDS